ncbi:MAG: ferredoxin family protein [Acidobacteria bacterium]|nr:ferredoxin family protein [Acidobacteriota bacterium]
MPPVINEATCTGCGICAHICPTDVFNRGPRGAIPLVRYPDECWHCNACLIDCPELQFGAIELRIPLPLMLLHVGAEFDAVGYPAPRDGVTSTASPLGQAQPGQAARSATPEAVARGDGLRWHRLPRVGQRRSPDDATIPLRPTKVNGEKGEVHHGSETH